MNEETTNKTVVITHTDLDGYGAGFLMELKEQPGWMIRSSGYNNLENVIMSSINGGAIHLIFTDICPTEKFYKETLKDLLISKGISIEVYDHHKTALLVNDAQEIGGIVDTTMCGTKIVYTQFKEELNLALLKKFEPLLNAPEHMLIKRLEDFVEDVNDYDMWIHERPYSTFLNNLVSCIRTDVFNVYLLSAINSRATDPVMESGVYYWETMLPARALVISYEANKTRYVDNKVKDLTSVKPKVDQNNYRYHTVFAEQHHSLLGHAILETTGVDYVKIIDLSNMSVSLRSKEHVDVSKIAKAKGGGGHKQAAGYPITHPIDLDI